MKRIALLIVCVLFIAAHTVAAQDNTRLTINRQNAGNLRLIVNRPVASISTVAWSPDSQQLAVGTDNTLELITISSGITRWEREARLVTGISWSHDGTMIAVMHDNGKVTVFDTRTGRAVVILSAAQSAVARFSPTDNLLAYNDGSQLYLASMQFSMQSRGWQMPARIYDLQWTQDGNHIAVVVQRDTLVWNINDASESFRLTPTDTSLNRIAWQPGQEQLAAIGSADTRVQLYDAFSGANLIGLDGHTDTPIDLAWSPDGTLLVTVGADNSLLLWDIAGNTIVNRYTIDTPHQVVWSPDGTQIAVVTTDSVQFWGVNATEQVAADGAP